MTSMMGQGGLMFTGICQMLLEIGTIQAEIQGSA